MLLKVLSLTVFVVHDSSAARRYYITSKNSCIDCGYNGENYQWCRTGGGSWDYCSRIPGTSTRNKKCRWNHQCDYHRQKYLWCYLEGGGWDYCGKVEDSSMTFYTTRGQLCYNFCSLDGKTYKCRKQDQSMDHCSPVRNVASHGSGCKAQSGYSKNACGNHGNSYKWCYTNDGSWGYCSQVDTDYRRRSRRPNNNICLNPGGANMRLTYSSVQYLGGGIRRWTAVVVEQPSNRIRLATGNHRNDAHTCLYDWQRRRPTNGNTNAGTQISRGTIRLDIQGSFNSANMGRFVNWQLQINGPTRFPSTVAHVNIQLDLRGFNDGGWRRFLVQGLHVSLNQGATVWIYQQQIDANGHLQCPRAVMGSNLEQLSLGINATSHELHHKFNETQLGMNQSLTETHTQLFHGMNKGLEELQPQNSSDLEPSETQQGIDSDSYEAEHDQSMEMNGSSQQMLELVVKGVYENSKFEKKLQTKDKLGVGETGIKPQYEQEPHASVMRTPTRYSVAIIESNDQLEERNDAVESRRHPSVNVLSSKTS